MQHKINDYNPEVHDKIPALTVKQPYAEDLVTTAREAEDGTWYGVKTIEVRSKRTSYRGDLLICSSANPVFPGMMSGVTLGIVELYDVKPISEFTPDDWDKTRIPVKTRKTITRGYGWLMRNPRRVVEMPVKGQLGIYNLVMDKGDIVEYPRQLVVDEKGWKQIQKSIKNSKNGK